MGWWSADEQGHSFATAEGDEMLWGDGPADIVDEMINILRSYDIPKDTLRAVWRDVVDTGNSPSPARIVTVQAATAIALIRREFVAAVERQPTDAELMSGLEFSVAILDENLGD
jgi:hypothetical protein